MIFRAMVIVWAMGLPQMNAAESGVPAAEFVNDLEPHGRWFLPTERGRPHLELEPHHPVAIHVIVNVTPSHNSAGPARVGNSHLGALLPMLKRISEIELPNATRDVEFLNLDRQRVTFNQKDSHDLDWPSLSESLKAVNSATIDMTSLATRSESAGFLVKEVARKLAGDQSQARRVVIVLSSPVVFESGQEPAPIPANPPDI